MFRILSSPVTLTMVPDGVLLQSVQAEPAPAGLIGVAVRAAGSMSRISSRALPVEYSVVPPVAGRMNRPVLRSLAAVMLVSGNRIKSDAKETAAVDRGSRTARIVASNSVLGLAAPLS
jgi:ribosomal protein L2